MNLSPSRTSTVFQDAEIFAAAALRLQADLAEGFDIGQGAAIEDGQFKVVELDDDIIDAHADQRREQVLGGGDEDALAHEAGGVADLGDVAADGGDFEVVEIGAAEDECRSRRGGQQPHLNRGSAVQAMPENSMAAAMVCSRC